MFIVTTEYCKEQLSRPEFASNNANMAGNALPFTTCVLIPNSCRNQTSARLQPTQSRDRRKRHALLTVLKTFICILLVPVGEKGSVPRRNLAGKKRGKQVLVVCKFTSPGFPEAAQHKHRKKKLEELPHPRQATFFTMERSSKLSQLSLLSLVYCRHPTSAPLVTTESTEPR